ncbi:MAG: MFS transporter [Alphaproteobacteria bacterium]|nr:MFS transporter [Alphaproteobacteria bacterium]MBL7097358.1 MFS transporter [Alphaproteobacteria bacterium]
MVDTRKRRRSPVSNLQGLPAGVWALGFVSMFMDISSEMIHSLLPVFLVSVLGASVETVGLVEGLGEATASISKLFSGWLSDRLGARKALTIFGYGLGALSKPFFAMAASLSLVLGARISDRLGKGIRGAPRDALVGDITPPPLRGAAYGLRQSLDTVGAFAGPLIAIALMALFHDNFRTVLWLAIVPGLVSVLILAVFVREPAQHKPAEKPRFPIRWSELSRFNIAFWSVVGLSAILTLARFSEAFLILRAQVAGLSLAFMPMVLVVMNIVYALAAYPMGMLSDRMDRRAILGLGFVVLIAADIVLATAPNLIVVTLGVVLWGLHMGMTQGLLAALVADAAKSELRGTAFGLFNFVSGIATLFASLIAGYLWQTMGPNATFLAGAGFTIAGLIAAIFLFRPADA